MNTESVRTRDSAIGSSIDCAWDDQAQMLIDTPSTTSAQGPAQPSDASAAPGDSRSSQPPAKPTIWGPRQSSLVRIGVDLDGVLYQFDKTAQYMLARHLGYEAREELAWDHEQYWRGVDKAAWEWLWKDEQVDPLFRHGHLYTGAIEFVQELARRGDVVIVTKRPQNATTVTIDWVNHNLGFYQEDGVWCHPVGEINVLGSGQDKSAVGCDVYIDDNPKICRELLENTYSTVAMIARPWNEDAFEELTDFEPAFRGMDGVPRFYRVTTFDEFIAVVDEVRGATCRELMKRMECKRPGHDVEGLDSG